MTEITYKRRGNLHELSIMGHAGYDEQGRDIVCAGVSAITYSLLGYLDDHEAETRDLCCDVRSGAVTVSCDGNERTRTAFDMALTGYRLISETYPDNVHLYTSDTDG